MTATKTSTEIEVLHESFLSELDGAVSEALDYCESHTFENPAQVEAYLNVLRAARPSEIAKIEDEDDRGLLAAALFLNPGNRGRYKNGLPQTGPPFSLWNRCNHRVLSGVLQNRGCTASGVLASWQESRRKGRAGARHSPGPRGADPALLRGVNSGAKRGCFWLFLAGVAGSGDEGREVCKLL